MSVMLVEFTKGSQVEHRHYNAGGTAGFPEEDALFLIASGVAKRRPKADHPLVSAALNHPDPEIRQLAHALQGIGPKLQDLETHANLRRDRLQRAAGAEAKALATGQPFNDTDRRDTQAQLDAVEKQITLLLDQEAPIFDELRAKIVAGLEQQAQGILKQIVPQLNALVAIVKKARPIFQEMQPAVAALDAVRTATNVAGLDAAVLNGAITEVLRPVIGDTVGGITGQSTIPDDLGVLLHAMASYLALT